MDDSTSERPPPPPAHLLRERMGSERAESGLLSESVIDAKFDKYTKLEDTAFAFFKHNRQDYLLHFHLESHDRCDVRLKPVHWDNGAYFRPELLKDGALRLIPHFIPIPLRKDAPRKRPLPSSIASDTTSASPRPQKRRTEDSEPPTPLVIADITEQLTFDDDELIEQEAFENTQSLKKLERRGQTYDHGMFKPRASTSLPQHATHSSWLIDFADARQRYINTHFNGITPAQNSARYKLSNHAAHREMIGGKYGMTSLIPCNHCVKAGVTCRVYHSECYEWTTASRSVLNILGWRCQRCRMDIRSVLNDGGGCNAQHEA